MDNSDFMQLDICLELKREVARLQQQLSELQEILGDDAQFKLAILERMPLTLWACDRECKIMLWNEAARKLYGYDKEQAIGSDFVDLFVDPLEGAQARMDVKLIVDNGKVIRNIANDKDSTGHIRRLLTHCFPVLDKKSGDVFQVELSFDISDIKQLEDEICDVRNQAKLISEKKTVEEKLLELSFFHNRKSGMGQHLQNFFMRKMDEYEKSLRTHQDLISTRGIPSKEREQYLKIIERERAGQRSIGLWYRQIFADLTSAKTMEEIDQIGREINNREDEKVS